MELVDPRFVELVAEVEQAEATQALAAPILVEQAAVMRPILRAEVEMVAEQEVPAQLVRLAMLQKLEKVEAVEDLPTLLEMVELVEQAAHPVEAVEAVEVCRVVVEMVELVELARPGK